MKKFKKKALDIINSNGKNASYSLFVPHNTATILRRTTKFKERKKYKLSRCRKRVSPIELKTSKVDNRITVSMSNKMPALQPTIRATDALISSRIQGLHRITGCRNKGCRVAERDASLIAVEQEPQGHSRHPCPVPPYLETVAFR